MKRLLMLLVLVGMTTGLTSLTWADQSKVDALDRLNAAANVLHEIMATPDKGIPAEVLDGAKCIAVIPHMIKGGLIFGAKHGRGVATCRLPNGQWSAPAFFTITGGSWGAQIGAESVDLVMTIMNENGMKHLLQNKFQIGGEASAAAGPVGRHASAGIDYKASTEILTYSRAKGAFAGLDLGGSWITPDKDSTVAFYGRDYPTQALLEGQVPAPPEAKVFLAAVRGSKAEAKEAKPSGV